MTRHPDPPLTEDQIDAFIDSQAKRHTLLNGSDTSRMAWRILKRLYFDRRDLRRENAALKTRIAELTGASGETNWIERVEKAG